MSNPEELARAQSEPGKFNFIERLRGRNYPETVVDFYLEEGLAYKIAEFEKAIAGVTNKEKLAEAEEALRQMKVDLRAQTYKIHLRGISNERYDELMKESEEAYPLEYNETINPFTGQKAKDVIYDENRDKMFSNALWAECITKIVDPDGNEADEVDVAVIANLRAVGPLDGLRKISEGIISLRMATDWMDHVQDEDFFPKP